MKQIGVNFPRVSYDQLQMGKRTSVADLSPGDLVGFGDGGHIAIYLGGGRILEAPRTGLDVRVRSLGKGEKAWGVSLDGIYR
jgi:cell wall-associated NlpC family hydrolase